MSYIDNERAHYDRSNHTEPNRSRHFHPTASGSLSSYTRRHSDSYSRSTSDVAIRGHETVSRAIFDSAIQGLQPRQSQRRQEPTSRYSRRAEDLHVASHSRERRGLSLLDQHTAQGNVTLEVSDGDDEDDGDHAPSPSVSLPRSFKQTPLRFPPSSPVKTTTSARKVKKTVYEQGLSDFEDSEPIAISSKKGKQRALPAVSPRTSETGLTPPPIISVSSSDEDERPAPPFDSISTYSNKPAPSYHPGIRERRGSAPNRSTEMQYAGMAAQERQLRETVRKNLATQVLETPAKSFYDAQNGAKIANKPKPTPIGPPKDPEQSSRLPTGLFADHLAKKRKIDANAGVPLKFKKQLPVTSIAGSKQTSKMQPRSEKKKSDDELQPDELNLVRGKARSVATPYYPQTSKASTSKSLEQQYEDEDKVTGRSQKPSLPSFSKKAGKKVSIKAWHYSIDCFGDDNKFSGSMEDCCWQLEINSAKRPGETLDIRKESADGTRWNTTQLDLKQVTQAQATVDQGAIQRSRLLSFTFSSKPDDLLELRPDGRSFPELRQGPATLSFIIDAAPEMDIRSFRSTALTDYDSFVQQLNIAIPAASPGTSLSKHKAHATAAVIQQWFETDPAFGPDLTIRGDPAHEPVNQRTPPRARGPISIEDSPEKVPPKSLSIRGVAEKVKQDKLAAYDNPPKPRPRPRPSLTALDEPARPTRQSARTRANEEALNKDRPLDDGEVMLVYPFDAPGAVSITKGDFNRLDEGEYLNDTLIEFGLKLILDDIRKRDAALADKIHIFNSFFYKKLSQRSKGFTEQDAYDSVKKWTAKFDLFDKDYIIIPVNEHFHWYLVIVVNPGGILETPSPPERPPRRTTKRLSKLRTSDDEQSDADMSISTRSSGATDLPSSPHQLVARAPFAHDLLALHRIELMKDNTSSKVKSISFDSMGGRHGKVHKDLRSYLVLEAKDKRGKLSSELSVEEVSGIAARCPEQQNYHDCGVYLLHFVDVFFRDPHAMLDNLLHRSMDRSTLASWRGEECLARRKTMQATITDLSKTWSSWKADQDTDEDRTDKEKPQTSDENVKLKASASVTEVPSPGEKDSSVTTTASLALDKAVALDSTMLAAAEAKGEQAHEVPVRAETHGLQPDANDISGKDLFGSELTLDDDAMEVDSVTPVHAPTGHVQPEKIIQSDDELEIIGQPSTTRTAGAGYHTRWPLVTDVTERPDMPSIPSRTNGNPEVEGITAHAALPPLEVLGPALRPPPLAGRLEAGGLKSMSSFESTLPSPDVTQPPAGPQSLDADHEYAVQLHAEYNGKRSTRSRPLQTTGPAQALHTPRQSMASHEENVPEAIIVED
ncbi:uncharacterized protein L969DRAFT_86927 [Mixia osmundae IAM 14324]|uniref:Ubiquitin-like protease family profile domain-containing protein n=1 Tax=Mixia osmundae (strain CBS 9802 / IAM 14324 / JCM 22182 / KY 12970) TaxID=764103 RepID=G7E933_MIXOS|nr:uncharacterized protein L969DRAFT_86927 [Mixia osmundae IAM 14324]KEI40287.1 hypothetical protein L969DRAFT_86927 [Mixia osmundae IAM 14324]GAA99651.1 hypothetical protein E5Q_06354 [Mixia osmundae IAM 14324]